jgi:hypothetical protein
MGLIMMFSIPFQTLQNASTMEFKCFFWSDERLVGDILFCGFCEYRSHRMKQKEVFCGWW